VLHSSIGVQPQARRGRTPLLWAVPLAAALCFAPGGPRAQAGPFVLPPAAEPAPLGAAGGTLVVSRFVFEGNRVLPTAELEALAAPFLNRPLRMLELEELRQRLTRAYVERGYVSSGAVIPESALRDGSLRFSIIEGRVSSVRANGLQGLSDAYLAARLVRDEAFNLEVLQERFHLLLADPLFERLNARLMPGPSLGTSIIDIDVQRARPWQLTLFANNHLAPAVGSSAAGIEATARNITGWGDTLNATLSRSRGSTNGDLGWTLPLGARATTLTLRVAQGESSVIEEPLTAVGIGSVLRSREATLAHPVIDDTRRRLTLGLSYGERRNNTSIDGEPFSFVAGEPTGSTQVRAWRFFQDLTMRFERHVLALRSTFVSGRNNLSAEPVLATQPSPAYRLWVGQAQGSLALGDSGTQLLLRANVQRSEDRLVALEQLSVGGRYTVRGYRENQLVRDNGWSASAELHWPLWRDDAGRTSLSVIPFVDVGSAHNRDEATSRLASAGLGLQWNIDRFEGEVFVARRIERRAADTHGDLQDHGIHLSLRYRGF